MYRAKELQRACPRSQAWLRQALANGLLGETAPVRTTSSTRRFATGQRPVQTQTQAQAQTQTRPAQLRSFSTSRRTLQEQQPKPDNEPSAESIADDIEKVVRETRATFGDTLPKDFLSEEEYKVYLRLYGSPLRETRAEDVGIPDAMDRAAFLETERIEEEELMEELQHKNRVADQPWSSLSRANEEGEGHMTEEFYYDANVKVYAEGEFEEQERLRREKIRFEAEAEAEPENETETDPNTPAINADTANSNEYIQAKARSERQYIVLNRLQRDFEAARLARQVKQMQKEDEERAKKAEKAAKEGEILAEDTDFWALDGGEASSSDAPHESYDEPYESYEKDDEELEYLDNVVGESQRTIVRRVHPLTEIGRSRTFPTTINLPKASFTSPIMGLLKRSNPKHVAKAARKAFGGKELPYSPRTVKAPPSRKETVRNRGRFGQEPVGLEAGQRAMTEIEADAYIAAALPPIYATALSTLVEVRRRLGTTWIENMISKADGSNPRVLDVGGGGAALSAFNSVFWSELAVLREYDLAHATQSFDKAAKKIPGRQKLDKDLVEAEELTQQREQARLEGQIVQPKERRPQFDTRKRMERTVVVGSDNLRHRISRFLADTTFLPRLPDLLHSDRGGEESRDLDAPETPHPDRGTGSRRKKYDLIIASHLLLPKAEEYERSDLIENLWAMLNPEGGVLIVLEKGHPRGFEAVAEARQLILDNFLEGPSQGTVLAEEASAQAEDLSGDDLEPVKREPGMIIAPCTNHGKCPMYPTPGVSRGRKDYCRFSQRYTRPLFLQKILAGIHHHHNHENVEFSYIAVQRGTQKPKVPTPSAANPDPDTDEIGYDLQRAIGIKVPKQQLPLPAGQIVQGKEATDAAFKGFNSVWTPDDFDTTTSSTDGNGTINPSAPVPHQLALPRAILPPLKRHGHVVIDVCTPAGTLERWTVPKSLGRQVYHDARKAQWGDLWPLGGKTRVPKSVRLGKSVKEEEEARRAAEAEAAALEDLDALDGFDGLDDLATNGDDNAKSVISDIKKMQARAAREAAAADDANLFDEDDDAAAEAADIKRMRNRHRRVYLADKANKERKSRSRRDKEAKRVVKELEDEGYLKGEEKE